MNSINGNTLSYNGHEITFMYPIKQILMLKEGCLVLMGWAETFHNRNVLLVTPEGLVKWQIQIIGNPDLPDFRPYGGMELQDGRVRVYNTIGVACTLNLDDGTISDCRVTK